MQGLFVRLMLLLQRLPTGAGGWSWGRSGSWRGSESLRSRDATRLSKTATSSARGRAAGPEGGERQDRRWDYSREEGFSTAELLGNAALGIIALVAIWGLLKVLGQDVVEFIKDQIFSGN